MQDTDPRSHSNTERLVQTLRELRELIARTTQTATAEETAKKLCELREQIGETVSRASECAWAVAEDYLRSREAGHAKATVELARVLVAIAQERSRQLRDAQIVAEGEARRE